MNCFVMKKSEPLQVLLLTAAINTSVLMGNNKRSDSELRRLDYLRALRFYIENLPQNVVHVVFCENTGADLHEFELLKDFAASKGRVLHILGFIGKTHPSLGKGVCEFEILDFSGSWLAENISSDLIIWKITGRLLLKNVSDLISSLPGDSEFYVDLRSVPLIGERLGGNDWAEMRLMCYRLSSYNKYFYGRGAQFGYVTEKGLFLHIQKMMTMGVNVSPRFLIQPRFGGICGGSNKNYESIEYRLKDFIRIISRRVFPQIWL